MNNYHHEEKSMDLRNELSPQQNEKFLGSLKAVLKWYGRYMCLRQEADAAWGSGQPEAAVRRPGGKQKSAAGS